MELIIFTFENEFFIIGCKWLGFRIGRYFYIASGFRSVQGDAERFVPGKERTVAGGEKRTSAV